MFMRKWPWAEMIASVLAALVSTLIVGLLGAPTWAMFMTFIFSYYLFRIGDKLGRD